jgi:hypothetical protein
MPQSSQPQKHTMPQSSQPEKHTMPQSSQPQKHTMPQSSQPEGAGLPQLKRKKVNEVTEVFNKIKDIPQTVLTSDLPNTFIATVLSATQTVKTGAYAGAPLLKLELKTDDNNTFSISYRIPKAFTGKGQLDLFIVQMKKLKLEPSECVGKKFEWQRIELEGAVSGNARFYPIKLIGQKKLGA